MSTTMNVRVSQFGSPVNFVMQNIDLLDADDVTEYLENTEQAIADLQKLSAFLRAKQRLAEASKDKHGENTPQPMMPKKSVRKAETVEYYEAWTAFFELRDSLPEAFAYARKPQ